MENKRRFINMLVNPKYQLKYVSFVFFTSFTLVTVLNLVFYVFIKENYDILVELSPMLEETKFQLYEELNSLIPKMIGGSFIFIFIMSFIAIILTHRAAGPLYHFKKVFKEIETGNMESRVSLRPNDEFQDVAVAFNSMMDKLKSASK